MIDSARVLLGLPLRRCGALYIYMICMGVHVLAAGADSGTLITLALTLVTLTLVTLTLATLTLITLTLTLITRTPARWCMRLTLTLAHVAHVVHTGPGSVRYTVPGLRGADPPATGQSAGQSISTYMT